MFRNLFKKRNNNNNNNNNNKPLYRSEPHLLDEYNSVPMYKPAYADNYNEPVNYIPVHHEPQQQPIYQNTPQTPPPPGMYRPVYPNNNNNNNSNNNTMRQMPVNNNNVQQQQQQQQPQLQVQPNYNSGVMYQPAYDESYRNSDYHHNVNEYTYKRESPAAAAVPRFVEASEIITVPVKITHTIQVPKVIETSYSKNFYASDRSQSRKPWFYY